MPDPVEIPERLFDFVGLTDVALRRRTEPHDGIFIAEGVEAASRALSAGYRVRSLVISSERSVRTDVQELAERVRAAGAPVHVESADVLRLTTGFDVHRGVLASFARRPLPRVDEVVAGARTLAVLEGIVDHTNVGALIRSAAGLEVDGLLLDPRCADPLYRRAIRTSMGAVFALPYARFEGWPTGLDDLRTSGVRVLALTPHAASVDLAELEIGPDETVALLMGSEGGGLSAAALARADQTVSIRMAAGVDSLNVAASAAVAFWGVARARDRHRTSMMVP